MDNRSEGNIATQQNKKMVIPFTKNMPAVINNSL